MDESAQLHDEGGSASTVRYTCIQGCTALCAIPENGNIADDPLFVDPVGPDGIVGTADDDLRLTAGSPCIDAGDNGALPSDVYDLDGDGDTSEPTSIDLAGNARFLDDPDVLDTGSGGASGLPIVDLGAFEYAVSTRTVLIDIKPGSYPNSINLGSNGVVPAAILSSAEFDATAVDVQSVFLAGAGVAVRGNGNRYMSHAEDVNGDGLLDLVIQVETENLNPDEFQDGYAIISGETIDGVAFQGLDEIVLVPN
jgi:hypothetical protein